MTRHRLSSPALCSHRHRRLYAATVITGFMLPLSSPALCPHCHHRLYAGDPETTRQPLMDCRDKPGNDNKIFFRHPEETDNDTPPTVIAGFMLPLSSPALCPRCHHRLYAGVPETTRRPLMDYRDEPGNDNKVFRHHPEETDNDTPPSVITGFMHPLSSPGLCSHCHHRLYAGDPETTRQPLMDCRDKPGNDRHYKSCPEYIPSTNSITEGKHTPTRAG